MDLSDSVQGPVASSCVHGIETSGSVNEGEFVEQLRGYQLLKQDSAA